MGITLEQLESAANGTQSWTQLAPLMQAQPSTAPVTSAPQLAFAPTAELQRSQLLPAQALLGASDSTTQDSGSNSDSGSSGQSSRLWTKSDPLQVRLGIGIGKLTVGAGLFPTRYFVKISGTDRNTVRTGSYVPDPDIEDGDRVARPGSFSGSQLDEMISEIDIVSRQLEVPLDNGIERLEGASSILSVSDYGLDIDFGKFGRRQQGGGGYDLVFSGLFGGVNQGSASSAVINTGKGEMLWPEDEKDELGKAVFPTQQGSEFGHEYSAISGGVSAKSVFSFGRGLSNPLNLTSYTSAESLGLGYLFHKSVTEWTGARTQWSAGFNVGLLAEQYHSSLASPLPEWLAYTGRGIETESILFNVAGLHRGLSERYDDDEVSLFNPLTVNSGLDGSGSGERDRRSRSKGALAIFNGFIVPAATDILLKATESSAPDRGFGVFGNAFGSYEHLTKWEFGSKIAIADQVNYYFKGAAEGKLQNITFVSAGSAYLFGGYIPLLTYYYKKTWETGSSAASSTTTATDPGSGDQSGTTDPQVSTSSATSSSTGSFSSAASGSNYPFLYNPDAPSSARVTSLAENPINAQMLGEAPSELYQFNLQATSDSTLFTIKSAGSALKPTTTPVEVDILGPTLESNAASSGSTALNSRAKALVSINAQGELESISISQPGSYLYLPETGNNTGEYFLPLDLASAGLINSTGLPPVVSVNGATAASSGAPLQLNRIERIAAQLYPVASGTSANASQQYPQLNPDGSSAPVNTRNNSYYY